MFVNCKMPVEWRENCSAWEFKAGHFCWFINGTFCRDCKVFQSRLPTI